MMGRGRSASILLARLPPSLGGEALDGDRTGGGGGVVKFMLARLAWSEAFAVGLRGVGMAGGERWHIGLGVAANEYVYVMSMPT